MNKDRFTAVAPKGGCEKCIGNTSFVGDVHNSSEGVQGIFRGIFRGISVGVPFPGFTVSLD